MVDDDIDQSEPTFARGEDGRMYRLQYQGMYRWRLYASCPGGAWERLWPSAFDELLRWGRETRRAGDPILPYALGIRLTGCTKRRRRLLGCDARCLGGMAWKEENGASVRHLFTSVHAETAFDGSIRVWARRYDAGYGGKDQRTDGWQQTGFQSLEAIRTWLSGLDVKLPKVKARDVRDLLERVEAEQTVVDAFTKQG